MTRRRAGVQGIDLTLKNPDTAVLRNGKIYISCVGAFLDFTDGGIEIVDTAENRSLGPGINEAELGGEVGAIAMSSDTRGYVVLGDSSFSNSIKPFDLSDRTASEPLDGHSGGFTPDIQIAGGKLYVADRGSFTDPESAGIPDLRQRDRREAQGADQHGSSASRDCICGSGKSGF